MCGRISPKLSTLVLPVCAESRAGVFAEGFSPRNFWPRDFRRGAGGGGGFSPGNFPRKSTIAGQSACQAIGKSAPRGRAAQCCGQEAHGGLPPINDAPAILEAGGGLANAAMWQDPATRRHALSPLSLPSLPPPPSGQGIRRLAQIGSAFPGRKTAGHCRNRSGASRRRKTDQRHPSFSCHEPHVAEA